MGYYENQLYGPTHPHQVLSGDTIGDRLDWGDRLSFFCIHLLVEIMGIYCAHRRAKEISPEALPETLPWMSAILIATMPINAHMAFLCQLLVLYHLVADRCQPCILASRL